MSFYKILDLTAGVTFYFYYISRRLPLQLQCSIYNTPPGDNMFGYGFLSPGVVKSRGMTRQESLPGDKLGDRLGL